MSAEEQKKGDFADRLHWAMARREKINAAALEARASMSSGHVTHMRKRKRGAPGWDIGDRMAKVLRVRTCWLLGGEEPMDDLNLNATEPRTWDGYRQATAAFFRKPIDDDLAVAVIGFGETPTTDPPATPMTAEKLRPMLEEWLKAFPPPERDATWQAWRKEAHARLTAEFGQSNATKRKRSLTGGSPIGEKK